MTNNLFQTQAARCYSGLSIFLVSLILLSTLLPFSLVKNLENRYGADIAAGGVRLIQKEYDRYTEESNSKNKEILALNEQMNTLVEESGMINQKIGTMMEKPPDKVMLDSINMLYQEKILVLEPRIDSLRTVFTRKTEEMVVFLGMIYEKEAQLQKEKLGHEMKKSLESFYFYAGVVILVVFLTIFLAGLVLFLSGLRAMRRLASA